MSKDASDIFPNARVPVGIPRPVGGYHTRPITRGVFGNISKVFEEMTECEDAHSQGSCVLLILELSDLVGAIRGFLSSHNLTLDDLPETQESVTQVPWIMVAREFEKLRPEQGFHSRLCGLSVTLHMISGFVMRWNLRLLDLIRMSDITQRAFENGERTPKDGRPANTTPFESGDRTGRAKKDHHG